MTEIQTKRKYLSMFWVAVISAFLTLIIVGSVAYLFGYFERRTARNISQNSASGKNQIKKVAYWRSPMNPTEIYNEPGKSAMGMDLVPVYEDELTGGDSSKDKDATARKIAYWRAPMNPTEIYNEPGKSAMGMDLIPVYEDELIGGVEVKVDPVIRQSMGIRTAVVKKGLLNYTIRTYGHITYDETRTAEVSPKISGWIDKINVDFTGKFVRKGEPLFGLYSPELFAAQEEFLITFSNLNRMSDQTNKSLLKSARRRLKYFDIADHEIFEIERSGKIKKNITIRSPVDGVVILKNAVAGSFIKAGTTIYRIADLSNVWVEAHIFEYELPWVSEGQAAVMTLPYLPGRNFHGKVTYVYPYLQRKTRDVVVRLEYKNPSLELKPDMYADVEIKGMAGEGLIVPSEAVIRSGKRNIIFVDRENSKFTPRDVTLGLSLDNQRVQILTGLVQGERIVTSGQFLLDSESKLKEAVQKMLAIKREKIKAIKPLEAGKEDIQDAKEEDFFKDLDDGDKTEDFFKDIESK
jgi:Cu(I)/Ag(I) efflux system membrane fusion protein/cobalt-zinc-cadmium efflux system membrane fusion protein